VNPECAAGTCADTVEYHRAAGRMRLAALAPCDSDELQSRLEVAHAHPDHVESDDLPARLQVRFDEWGGRPAVRR
jgi:hypothetical protein